MNTKKDFLVCIRCFTYNQSAFITDAMNGFVMQQTNFPYVTVVIDDASTDGEQEVINAYVDYYFDHSEKSSFRRWETDEANWIYARHKDNENCYFVVVFLKKNLYGNPKKNELIEEWCDAKYFAPCEGDDYWTDPLKLRKQVEFMEEHEDYSMCCTAFSQTFEGDEKKKSNIIFDLDEITLDHIIKGQWIGTLTVVYRKELMDNYHSPFPDLPMSDLPSWCHLAMKGKIKYLKDVTANYRRLNGSVCHYSDTEKQFRFSLYAMRVREYYAMKTNKLDMVQPIFSKNSHYYFEQCYKNQWFDFPMDTLWRFIKEYGHPSGYDKLKYWGMKSKHRYRFSKAVLSMLKK